MNLLRLWFDQSLLAHLTKVEFYSASRKDVRISTRGKVTVTPTTGTFIWSHGVRALSLLLVKAKVAALTSAPSEKAMLSGSRGSLAASLDYALSKSPAWLLDVFGTDLSGTPTALHLFKRVNPERKRPGPVEIFLNTKVLSAANIDIFVNEERIQSSEGLLRLLKGLGGSDDISIPEPRDELPTNFVTALPTISEFTFRSLMELDSFFGKLHSQLQRSLPSDIPLIGELRHAWWPLLMKPTRVKEVRAEEPVTYSTRRSSNLDLWVANEYRRKAAKVLDGSASNLPFDFWVYGDTVSQIFIPNDTVSEIEDHYGHGRTHETFDPDRFRAKCLEGQNAVKLVVLKNQSLAEELRRHVLSQEALDCRRLSA